MRLQRIEGQRVCWATDRFIPNFSTTARSRVLHLEHISKDRYAFPATQCGKFIVEFVTRSEFGLGRSVCVQCTKQSLEWKYKNGGQKNGNT